MRRWVACSSLLALACVDVGVAPVEVPLYLAGTASDDPIAGKGGAQIELERAELAFGPIYLCAGAQAGDLCDAAQLEWLDALVIDVLAPAPVEAGELRGSEGTVRSWMFDLGIVSLLTQKHPLVLPAAEQLGGASLRLEGRATLEGVVIPFALALAVQQEDATETGVPVIRKSGSESFSHEVGPDEPGLLIRFDARPWVTQIDFAALLEDRSCALAGPELVCAGQTEQRCDAEGNVVELRDCAALEQVCVGERGCVEIVEFTPDSQGYRAVRNQVVAGPRPAFTWGFSP
ncbi:MAG: hypothetical protein R6X02_14020 [Enhygromyxa sp.]